MSAYIPEGRKQLQDRLRENWSDAHIREYLARYNPQNTPVGYSNEDLLRHIRALQIETRTQRERKAAVPPPF